VKLTAPKFKYTDKEVLAWLEDIIWAIVSNDLKSCG